LSKIFSPRPRHAAAAFFVLTGFWCVCLQGGAQLTGSTFVADAALPDSPSMSAHLEPSGGAPSGEAVQGASPAEASKTGMEIEPGQGAPALGTKDKVVLGLKNSVGPTAAVGWLASAGYEQLLDGSPNYGTDRGAFGQRLGAAALRDISEDIFTGSVFSPMFREDPRYYRLGPSHNLFVRLIYSGTRPVIGRTDGGRTTLNFASLAGNLAGSGLTNAYYPQVNRGATQTMETFGGSLGGAAVGDVVSEFLEDFLHLFHSGH